MGVSVGDGDNDGDGDGDGDGDDVGVILGECGGVYIGVVLGLGLEKKGGEPLLEKDKGVEGLENGGENKRLEEDE